MENETNSTEVRVHKRRFWILPKIQFRFVYVKFQLTLMAYILAPIVLINSILVYNSSSEETDIISLVLTLLAIVVVAIFYSLNFSLRIAGPIHSFKMSLKKMKEIEGNALQHIKFRKGDFFTDLESDFNEYVDFINENYEIKKKQNNNH
ncbi:MAG: hypothetical protein ISR65_00295 [Bacteriovoracaceae bacterium]|nr:hypothetical protein [Bacteriovoracaceae bacterium]